MRIGKKYKPYFKIKSLNGVNDKNNTYWFTITNEGFPFYVINEVVWLSEGASVMKQFNGLIEKKRNGELTEQYESLTIILEIHNYDAFDGKIQFQGLDVEHNKFIVKTPTIDINKEKILNGEDLTYQYLN